MIRVTRGPEPAELSAARERGLGEIRAARGENPDHQVKSGDIDGYQCAAEPLWRAQGEKCCYCEKDIDRSYNDVEHYRPKTQYWWLAWDWSNLLFACPQCNRSNKRASFPLLEESDRLQPEQRPPGDEQPLLIDPAGTGDPLDSIEFVPQSIGRRTRWIPIERNRCLRGRRTIEVLRLGHALLVERYSKHVNGMPRRLVNDVRDAIQTGNAREIQRAWRRLIRSCLQQDRPFAALSHDFIAHHIPAEIRARWNLDLPRPPLERTG